MDIDIARFWHEDLKDFYRLSFLCYLGGHLGLAGGWPCSPVVTKRKHRAGCIYSDYPWTIKNGRNAGSGVALMQPCNGTYPCPRVVHECMIIIPAAPTPSACFDRSSLPELFYGVSGGCSR